MRLVHGIKVTSEDMTDYVTLPMIDEEEKEPFLHDEIRKILDFTRMPRRKCLYMVLKDTGCRIGEALRLQRKFIDMTANPVTIFFPKNIVKGKKRKRTAFVSNETKKMLETVLADLDNDDYVFGAPTQKDFGYRTEESAFDWVRRYTNMRDRYESNKRYKKNLHSFRSFCYTQSKLATGDADYAHGYIGHDRYLVVYERMQDKEKIDLFNRCVSRLSIFEDVVVVSDDELKNQHAKEILELNQKYDELKNMILTSQRNPGIKIGFDELPNIER
ncbi:MAG: tyrosine-type recombinase/integrase [Nitrosopumilus sp.]|nr:MAG: tyrosine-type recombinase/integrase [Nitrosopumilus sp.]